MNYIAILLFLAVFGKATVAHAMCPVCTVAVVAGVETARYFNLDDTISGIWIGALTISMIIWTINWLNGRKIKFIGRKPLIVLAYFAMVYIPLWKPLGMIGDPNNTMWHVDKIILGGYFGAPAFLLSYLGYIWLKAKNNGHAHFPFEKVVLVLIPLLALSGIFYYLTY